MDREVPLRDLNNSRKIPILAFGTYQGYLYDLHLSHEAVDNAIDYGYRLFDCSPIYLNEKEIGKVFEKKILKGVVKREDLFVVTKVWITNHKSMNPTDSLRSSLRDLKLDYVDLFLMTWPFAHTDDVDFVNVWVEMESLVRQNLTRAIGVCNFNLEQIKRLVRVSNIKPAVLQVECHINLNQKELLEYCNSEGIVLMGCTPFGDVHEATDGPYSCWKSSEQVTLQAPEMLKIAKKHGRTVNHIALRYLIQLGVVPIPKSFSLLNIISNINIFNFQLTQEEMAIIEKLDCGKRILTARQYRNHKHYPFY